MTVVKLCRCGRLVHTIPCPACKRESNRKRNAVPQRRAHHTKRHRAIKTRVFARDGYACAYCGSSTDLTVDYLRPLVLGGEMHERNAVTACRPCNSRRGGGLSRGGTGAPPTGGLF